MNGSRPASFESCCGRPRSSIASIHSRADRLWLIGAFCATSPPDWSDRHASLDLRTMRRAVSRKRRSAARVPGLRGRAAICELEGPEMARPRGDGGTSQTRLARRSRNSRHRRRAKFCDRAARAAGAHGRWLRDVGLRPDGDERGHRLRPLARRPGGHRRLPSALLRRGRRLERGVRRCAGLPAWR